MSPQRVASEPAESCLPAEAEARAVRLALRSRGYPRWTLAQLPDDGAHGSRELLLALAWLLARGPLLEQLLVQTRVRLGDEMPVCEVGEARLPGEDAGPGPPLAPWPGPCLPCTFRAEWAPTLPDTGTPELSPQGPPFSTCAESLLGLWEQGVILVPCTVQGPGQPWLVCTTCGSRQRSGCPPPAVADGKASVPVAKPDGQSAGAMYPPGQGSATVCRPPRPSPGCGLSSGGMWNFPGLAGGSQAGYCTGCPEPEPRASGSPGQGLEQAELALLGPGPVGQEACRVGRLVAKVTRGLRLCVAKQCGRPQALGWWLLRGHTAVGRHFPSPPASLVWAGGQWAAPMCPEGW